MANRVGPEEKARRNINSQLSDADWTEIDNVFGTGYIEEYETKSGPADYVLVVDGEILGIIEAKKKSEDPYGAHAQADRYAKDIETHYEFGKNGRYSVPFIFTTNGEEIYFRDLREKSPTERQLRSFHRPEGLRKLMQKDYENSLNWFDEHSIDETRKGLWNNQKGAIRGDDENKGIEPALQEGKRKVLVQMATGTGKTWMAAAQIHRLLESGLVNRALFLVDRKNLGKQAATEFENFDLNGPYQLGEEYEVERLESGEYTDRADIVVSTLQGMYSLLENHEEYDIPQDAFDLIVTDEVHRSIYGEWKIVLSHFDSYQIGLTATPAQHTIAYFDEWVYKYPYWDAVEDGKVVPYETYRIETDITMEGLDYDGKHYNPGQLERDITVPDRNYRIAKEFRENSEDDEKTLVFAINDAHANELEKQFRKVYSDKSQNYVQKITYKTDNPEGKLSNFKNPNMDEPTIAVTVEMVSTGTDVKPIENIVFVRPVKSPILYNQMVGRGTRKCEDIGKKKFTIYDCVGVIEYFNDQEQPPFDQYRPTEEQETSSTNEEDEEKEDETEKIVKADDVTDQIQSSGYVFRTEEGEEMKPDDYISAFEKYIRNNKHQIDAIKAIENKPSELKREDLEKLNEKLRERSENFTEEKLKKAYSEEMTDLVGLIKHALGEQEFPTTEERVEKAFEAWEQNQEFTEEEKKWLQMMKEHFKREKTIKKEDFQDIPFIRKGGWDAAAEAFGGEEKLKDTLQKLNNEVILA
ncbi:MAG: type I restriction-modification enzyme R subunit C-terminal domain-containing protein [Candidatus Nanohaloarchaea archaeon]